MEVLFAPFQVFQLFPALALVPALLLLSGLVSTKASHNRRPTRLLIGSALLWILYAIWEYRVQVWAETVTAPIRVDLLLIAPLLIVTTVWSCFAWFRWYRAAN